MSPWPLNCIPTGIEFDIYSIGATSARTSGVRTRPDIHATCPRVLILFSPRTCTHPIAAPTRPQVSPRTRSLSYLSWFKVVCPISHTHPAPSCPNRQHPARPVRRTPARRTSRPPTPISPCPIITQRSCPLTIQTTWNTWMQHLYETDETSLNIHLQHMCETMQHQIKTFATCNIKTLTTT
jgi:hypothetical protein